MADHTKKPAVLIIPGTWCGPKQYGVLADLLEKDGFESRIVDLPSNGAIEDTGDFVERDTATVTDVLRALTTEGKNVVMFCHSCGSLPGCPAVETVTEESRQTPSAGRVVRIIYLNAHLLHQNTSFLENWGDHPMDPNAVTIENGIMQINGAAELFFNDLPADEAAHAASLGTTAAASAWTGKISIEGWKDAAIPVTWIRSTNDVVYPPDMHEMYLERLRAVGINPEVVEIHSSHCASYSAPEKVADIVRNQARTSSE